VYTELHFHFLCNVFILKHAWSYFLILTSTIPHPCVITFIIDFATFGFLHRLFKSSLFLQCLVNESLRKVKTFYIWNFDHHSGTIPSRWGINLTQTTQTSTANTTSFRNCTWEEGGALWTPCRLRKRQHKQQREIKLMFCDRKFRDDAAPQFESSV